MAVCATPRSWDKMFTVRINGTDSPKLFYDQTMTLELFNEWRKDVTVALCGHAGCHAALTGQVTYATLEKDCAKLKAANTSRLDDYQVGDTAFKAEDWSVKQYFSRKTLPQHALNRIYQTRNGCVDNGRLYRPYLRL